MVFFFLVISQSMFRMFTCPFIILLTCLTSNAQSLEEYRWENRLIFIMNPDMDKDGGHPQLKAFDDHATEMEERDIRIFIIQKNKVFDLDGRSVEWTGKTIRDPHFKGVVLIGKDGGIKLEKPFIVTAREFFDLIDSMPMRRAEMKSSVKD